MFSTVSVFLYIVVGSFICPISAIYFTRFGWQACIYFSRIWKNKQKNIFCYVTICFKNFVLFLKNIISKSLLNKKSPVFYSAKGRTDCLLALRTAFVKKYIFDFIFDR